MAKKCNISLIFPIPYTKGSVLKDELSENDKSKTIFR